MQRKPLIIGHRGASAVAPENTMAAFRAALEVGADGIEFDVQLSRDGIPVVIHDDNLRRTGSVDRLVADLLAAELCAIDVGNWFWRKAGGTGVSAANEICKVPTLTELFALFENTSSVLYLEMKSAAGQSSELTRVCCEMIRRSSIKEQIIVESFDLNALAQIKRLDDSIRTAPLFEPKLTSPEVFFGLGMIDQATSVAASEIALHRRLASPRVIEKARTAGLGVVVWTVDDPRWLADARSLQIDALITNNPALMLEHDASKPAS